MPRPNRNRTIATEQALARRIAYERDKRGMTYDGLASLMTAAGCPIQASALYKIEKADPPRRITVDELVALSRVFEIPVGRLLLPPEVAASKEATALWEKYEQATERYLSARAELDALELRILRLVDSDESGTVRDAMAEVSGGESDSSLLVMRQYQEMLAESERRRAGAQDG